jgi:hypothetical protein
LPNRDRVAALAAFVLLDQLDGDAEQLRRFLGQVPLLLKLGQLARRRP